MAGLHFKQFTLPDWAWERKHRIMYLIIGPGGPFESVNVRPTEKFESLVMGHLREYINDGKMPPADISSSILNLADDFLAGREMTLRAGDYIALQNHMRKM